MKTTYEDFINRNSLYSIFRDNEDSAIVFSILAREASIVRMIAAIDEGEPALTPCVKAIENLLEAMPNSAMDLTVSNNRRVIGAMARLILEPCGYEPIREANGDAVDKPLPDEIGARFFKKAAVYKKI